MDERIKNIKETSRRYCTCHNKLIDDEFVDHSIEYYCSVTGEPLDCDFSYYNKDTEK